ncbi:MAG: hypothetical protein ACLSG7_07280 [Clostridia bacterium]
MKKTNEKGITIITLVITIIILLILASIGVNSGKGTIELAKYDKLRNELTIIQTKVNDLNQENKTEIGQKISTAQKSILNIDTVSNIIYSGRTEAEKAEIENGFRYCSSNYIEKQFELDGIERDYLINVEYRYVVSCEGLEYKGTVYYMIDQMESGLYNVAYHNKNSNIGSFDVSAEKVGEKYKISVSNIQHEGYVSNWQVKYKLSTEENWKTSNKLEFEVEKAGTYIVKVVHGNEIDLGEKTLYVGPILAANKVKVGDYIKYTPDTASTDTILQELNTYSGSSENTASTLRQESLNWRVLDIKGGQVRLISELPTTSKIKLNGYNGYNNAVKLLDDTCNILYTNKQLASKVQNIKIEDIQDKMVEKDYSKFNSNYGKIFTPNHKYYPNILIKEKEQKVNGTSGTELGLSEQTELINQTTKPQATSLEVKNTSWAKTMTTNDFKDSKYYELFINNGSNYPVYWMSSRCVNADSFSGRAYFYVRLVDSGYVSANYFYESSGGGNSHAYAFRPIITLNSNVQIDTVNSGNGSTAQKAYAIK